MPLLAAQSKAFTYCYLFFLETLYEPNVVLYFPFNCVYLSFISITEKSHNFGIFFIKSNAMKHSKRWKGRKIRRRACRLAAGFRCRRRVPSAGPEAGPMPNFFMQFMQQVQQRGGGRHDAGPVQDNQQPVPIITLFRTALANASLEHQRLMLGENLFPLVDAIEPNYCCKVTGMLLELDKDEVLHLIESPDALKARVADALEALRNAGWHC